MVVAFMIRKGRTSGTVIHMRTEWRGTWFGICVGLVGAGIAAVWPTAITGWAFIAIGVSGAIVAFLNRWLRLWVTAIIGILILMTMGVGGEVFKDKIMGVPSGPRFEFLGIKVDIADGQYKPIAEMTNTSNIPTISYEITASTIISDVPNIVGNKDVKAAYEQVLNESKKYELTSSNQMQVTRGVVAGLSLAPMSYDTVDLLNSNKKFMYIIIIAKYRSQQNSPNRMWVTEVCALVTKPFSTFQSCPSYNDYFYSDNDYRKLN